MQLISEESASEELVSDEDDNSDEDLQIVENEKEL
jgi:hypothetical protein